MDRSRVITSDRWTAGLAEARSLVDKLGMPLDPGIVDTVVVLRLLGFKTYMSCWGHPNWGLNGPWVAIKDGPEVAELRRLLAVYSERSRSDPRRRVRLREVGEPPELSFRLEAEVSAGAQWLGWPRLPADLRATRRQMAAFTDVLITTWAAASPSL